MALEAKLVQKLSQNLLMTPQLQQAIKLLQLGRFEFIEAIQNELLENPVLEESREEEQNAAANGSEMRKEEASTPDQTAGDNTDAGSSASASEEANASTSTENSPEESPVDWERFIEQFTDYSGISTPKGQVDHENRPSLEATLTKEQTLAEYLREQIRMSDESENAKIAAFILVGNIDRYGFLSCGYEEICRSSSMNMQDLEQGLSLIRDLDPVGVGARDLSECLFFQLQDMGKSESLEAKIVLRHLDSLANRQYEQIAKAEDVMVEQVYEAVKCIQELEPRPGRQFADDDIRYITPDIYVQKINGEFVVLLNEDGMPKLRVSPYYLELLKDGGKDGKQSKEYLNDRLKAASWLIKSIHQRQQTIFKVTESIVKFQRAFLEEGIHKLKPLVLKDVADDIGMHESTVSRVTTNKYVHTPQGVFELKFFFTTGIKTGGGDVSSSAVKERIREIIKEEDPAKPISDQKIVETLKAEGVQIARRTVAKYREGLGILSSSKRKKVF